ncbi:MAG: hypothetical protein ABI560_11285 [Myxococcales bacterium]
MTVFIAVVASSFALFSVALPAYANGRFPEANQLVVDPADPRHLVVRTTFGILRSFDAGATWTWTCEEAVSPLGLLDEEILITSAGRTWVALSDGIATADRQGCGWKRVSGDLVGQHVIDMVGDSQDRDAAYAALGVTVNSAMHGRIARTTDGASWSFVGGVLFGTVPLTIEIAPSRPQRLYLGVNDSNYEFGYIDVSDDAGLTWVRHDAPLGVDSVYVSGVDPQQADRVYVRKALSENTVYVSEDGAGTWKAIHSAARALTGFALSPDGRSVAVGGEDGVTILAREDVGDGTSTFSAVAGAAITAKCLTWTDAGLFACASEGPGADAFTIGLSVDDGKTFKALLRLPDLAPARCPEGTGVANTCPGLWCQLAATINATCPAPALPSSGCGCAMSGAPSTPLWQQMAAVVAVGTAVTALGWRRRRQRRRPL